MTGFRGKCCSIRPAETACALFCTDFFFLPLSMFRLKMPCHIWTKSKFVLRMTLGYITSFSTSWRSSSRRGIIGHLCKQTTSNYYTGSTLISVVQLLREVVQITLKCSGIFIYPYATKSCEIQLDGFCIILWPTGSCTSARVQTRSNGSSSHAFLMTYIPIHIL